MILNFFRALSISTAKMLCGATRKTFERHGTELSVDGTPVAFTPEFYKPTDKKTRWTAFCTRNAT